MGGAGGFFGSQASTPQVPTPVSTIPGAQGLGQALVNYFTNILSGGKTTAPYQGYASVYGTGTPTLNAGNQMSFQGAFPGLYTNPAPAPSAPTPTPSPIDTSSASFQNIVNNAIQQAIGSSNMYGGALGLQGGGGRA